MGKIYRTELPSGERAASTVVDLDGVQVLVRLFNAGEDRHAEVRFRGHPGDPWSEPVVVDADDEDD